MILVHLIMLLGMLVANDTTIADPEEGAIQLPLSEPSTPRIDGLLELSVDDSETVVDTARRG